MSTLTTLISSPSPPSPPRSRSSLTPLPPPCLPLPLHLLHAPLLLPDPTPWLKAEVCSSCSPLVATTLIRRAWWNSDFEFRIISGSVLEILTASCTCLDRHVEWHWTMTIEKSASWLACSNTQCFHNALFSLFCWSPWWCSTPLLKANLPFPPSYIVFFPNREQVSQVIV